MHPTLHVTPKTALKTLFRGGKKVGACVCVWGGGGGGGGPMLKRMDTQATITYTAA